LTFPLSRYYLRDTKTTSKARCILEGLPQAAERLHAYIHGGQSGFLDEPATAAAMAGFLLRGLDCGALDAAELDRLVGVDPGALAVLARRRPKP
jgi:uncharacterized protein DUF6986